MNREERNGYEVMRDERDIARDEIVRLAAENEALREVLRSLGWDEDVALLPISAETGDTD